MRLAMSTEKEYLPLSITVSEMSDREIASFDVNFLKKTNISKFFKAYCIHNPIVIMQRLHTMPLTAPSPFHEISITFRRCLSYKVLLTSLVLLYLCQLG